jgi:Rps23 Pro-64 3,4-dihydroxylase Tpa1-like proline 4-hydroxylase
LSTPFKLRQRHTHDLRAQFARDGRVRIEELLDPEGSTALRAELSSHLGWRHVLNGGDKVFESEPDAIEHMQPGERAALEAAIMQTAAHGFQFRYDSIRVPDDEVERAARPDLLTRFAEFMSCDEVLAWLAEITGDRSPQFADAQATRYRAGHFLTRHDDDVAGNNRSCA